VRGGQGVPDWQAALVPVARSLGNVTALVNAQVAQLLNSTSSLLTGRRRLQQVGPRVGPGQG
jgi:hypothetical protein